MVLLQQERPKGYVATEELTNSAWRSWKSFPKEVASELGFKG